MELKEIIKELEAYHKLVENTRKDRVGLQILDFPIRALIRDLKGKSDWKESLPSNVLRLSKFIEKEKKKSL